MFCPNQCSGRGACRLGFCHCAPGWWGLDCAHAATAATAAEPRPEPQHWLREVSVDAWACASGRGGCLEDLVARVDREPWPAHAGLGRSPGNSNGDAGDWEGGAQGGGGEGGSSDSGSGEGGTREGSAGDVEAPDEGALGADYEYDAAAGEANGGVPRPKQQQRRAALRAARLRALRARRSLAASSSVGRADGSGSPGGAEGSDGGAAAGGRLRPLIYVYDVPSIYAGRMLQYRMYRESCTWRWFDAEYDNATLMSAYPYGAAPA